MTGDSRRRPPDAKRVVADDKAEAKTAPIVAWIVVMSGRQKGEEFRLREGRNSVGSGADCQVRIADPHVSERHANVNVKRTSERTASYTLVNLDATNGTFHNDGAEPIDAADLVDNDTITFGTTKCKFKAM
jgi:S-DNA-T family DNA segregation ATPase FtsK/SpoIIIE